MKHFNILFLIFSLLTAQSFAQEKVLSGTIVNESDGQPIANVSVDMIGSSTGTTTDSNGFFLLKVNLQEKIRLRFSFIGYETLTRDLDLKKPTTGLQIHMKELSANLDEVEIMGFSSKNKPYRTEHIGITTLQQSNQQDVGAVLRSIPNVNGVRKGAMGIDPVIRGFKYSQLNVQVNGGTKIEGGCPNRMDPATAHIDLNDLKEIRIIKGPFALKYGVNFGGMINLTTMRPIFYNKYQNHVSALLGGQTNHVGYKTKVTVYGGNKSVSYDLSGSWKKYGDYKAGNGEVVPASLEQQTFAGMIGIKPAENHMIYADADISKGNNIDFPTLPMDERTDDTKLFSLNYLGSEIGNSINFIRFKAYLSDVNHEMDNKNRPFSDTVVAISNIHARNMGGKFGVNFNVGKAKIETGADYENIYKDGKRYKHLITQPMLPVRTEDLWKNARINNLGLFGEYTQSISSIDLVAALRVDLNYAESDTLIRKAMNGDMAYLNIDTKSNHTNLSASVGITWHISTQSQLTGSLGRGIRSPDMTERFIILLPVGYDNYDYLGNPALKPEVNNEVDLGYRFDNNKFGHIEVSGFYSYVTNYISTELVPPSEVKPQTKGVLGVKRFINIDKAMLSGFEFTYVTPLRYLWSVGLSAAYTAGWNPEATRYIYESGQVVDEEIIKNDPLPEIPPFETNLKVGYRFFKEKLGTTFRIRYAVAQNRVSVAFGEKETPAFINLGFDVNYKFNNTLTVFAGVNNILNSTYYEHLNRKIIGSDKPLYEVGRVFYANLIFKL
jgi:iron complex outermembrane recepter protein